MRLILFIPVVVLFLSNVPFIQEMPIEEMMAMMGKEECSKEKTCNAADMPDEGACSASGSSCVCICVFQYAAPAQDIKAFQIISIDKLAGYTGYLQSMWQDPHIALPGQPPDWA